MNIIRIVGELSAQSYQREENNTRLCHPGVPYEDLSRLSLSHPIFQYSFTGRAEQLCDNSSMKGHTLESQLSAQSYFSVITLRVEPGSTSRTHEAPRCSRSGTTMLAVHARCIPEV